MSVTASHAPPVERFRLEGRDGSVFEFEGRRLGHGSSDEPDKPRWFEVNVYSRHSPISGEHETYVVHTQGKSRVAGETTRARISETTSAYEIVELLTVVNQGRMYIPRQSARALAQAAQWDDDVRDAYVNRAVT